MLRKACGYEESPRGVHNPNYTVLHNGDTSGQGLSPGFSMTST